MSSIKGLSKRYNYRSYLSTRQFVLPVANNAQEKTNYEYVCDNTGQNLPNDFYNAYFDVRLKCQKKDGRPYDANDKVRLINGAHSLIRTLNVSVNGAPINHTNAYLTSHILNMLDISKPNAQSIKELQYFSPDTSSTFYPPTYTERKINVLSTAQAAGNNAVASKEESVLTVPVQENVGKYERERLIEGSREINIRIPLNRYGFFESLADNPLSPARVSITVEINDDDTLIDRDVGTAIGRVVIFSMVLRVPQIIPSLQGEVKFQSELFKDERSWTFLRERYDRSLIQKQQSGTLRIPGVRKPKHLFVWFKNGDGNPSQAKNPLVFNTYDIGLDGAGGGAAKQVSLIQVTANNGEVYPAEPFRPDVEPVRLYSNLLEYNGDLNNDVSSALIDFTEFQKLYGLIYFDLSKTGNALDTDSSDITVNFTLNGGTRNDYQICAMTLYESDVTLKNINQRAFLETK